MIDFANSYMTWFGAAGGSISRIDIEAACTLIDDAGAEDAFYLIAPCRAEHTHSDGQLIVMPNYDFRGIFGRTEYRIIRTHWVSDPDYLGDPGLETTGGRVLDESGLHGGKWDEVRLDVSRFDSFMRNWRATKPWSTPRSRTGRSFPGPNWRTRRRESAPCSSTP